MLFVSRLNTYLCQAQHGTTQQHVCAYFDKNTFPPSSEQEMRKLGYTLEEMPNGLFAFSHPMKGYLVLHPDMTLNHHSHILNEDCYIRQIDPNNLPPPPPSVPAEHTITKYIHQTGKDAEIPEAFRDNRDSLILLNPDYEYHYWSNQSEKTQDFIRTYYGDSVLKSYNTISPKYGAAKADLFRYLCIYHFGGVYLDLKSTITIPLKKIIQPGDTCLLSFWPRVNSGGAELQHIKYAGEYEQFFLICAAGHPLMRRIVHQTLCNIKLYDPCIHGVGLKGTFLTTGPIMFSRVVNSYRSPKTTRLFHSRSNGIEYSIFKHNEHYKKLGEHHYTEQKTPLIIRNMA